MRVLVVADETTFYQPNFINELVKDLKHLAETLFLFYVYHNKTSVSRPEYDICAQECKICGFSGSSFVAL